MKPRIKSMLSVLVRVVALLVLAATSLRAEQVSELRVRHRAGQTFLTWKEVNIGGLGENLTFQELKAIQTRIEKERRIRYRIYRSTQPIGAIAGMKPIAEIPPLSAWNMDYYGIAPKPEYPVLRYVVEDGKQSLGPGAGLHVLNPEQPGKAFYAVTLSINGNENRTVGPGNTLQSAVDEVVGQGLPVLQRVVKPPLFNYVENPTLHYYVRWEAPPNSSVAGKPFDYVVAIPPKLANPAPVGLHLHAWGGSLNHDYGWWYNAEKSAVLIASNQIPYDWWTGYHERWWSGRALKTKEEWTKGVVRPYTQRRLISFLEWASKKWPIDLARAFVAGSSMGGSGAPMFALRFPERFAWAVSWVGIHVPLKSPQFKSSYEEVYGKPEWAVKFEDGSLVWDYFDNAKYLRRHPDKDIGLVTFANGKNDSAIGWPQAVEFVRALQDTRQAHIFVWGQAGHGQRAVMPRGGGERIMPIDLRTNQSLPAFTNCSLDQNPGTGDPGNGEPQGQINAYLYWETKDIVDRPERWEMTIGVVESAPADNATVDITPRRRQEFKVRPGEKVSWSNISTDTNTVIQSGQVDADQWGLITLKNLLIGKRKNRVSIAK